MSTICIISYFLLLYAFIGIKTPFQSVITSSILLGSILIIALSIKNHWPPSLQRYFPVYWHFTLLYCLPILPSLLYLLLGGSNLYLVGIGVALLLGFADRVTFTLLSVIGIAIGIGLYQVIITFIPPPSSILSPSLQPLVYIAISAIPLGLIIIRQKEKYVEQEIAFKKLLGRTVDHEVRNDLNPATSNIYYINSITKYSIDEAGRMDPEYYKDVKHSGKVAEKFLTKSLKTLKMITSAMKDDISKAQDIGIYSCKELVTRGIDNIHFEANQREGVTLDLTEDFPIYFSAFHLEHILSNLFRNAYKYGGQEVSICVRLKDYSIYVRDNGVGIPKKNITRIFDPYFTTKGTGIGLSFSKKVMETFQASISCQSKQGEESYTEFVLKFPPVKKQRG